MAVAQGADGTSPLGAQAHTVAFERSGGWNVGPDEESGPVWARLGIRRRVCAMPSGSASTPKPAGSEVPLFITH